MKNKQLGAGRTIVDFKQHGGSKYGMLANHIWGVNNLADRALINSTFLQPFLVYTAPTAVSFASRLTTRTPSGGACRGICRKRTDQYRKP